MREFERFGKKALSICLCLCLLAGLLPAAAMPAKAAVTGNAVADKGTHNDWQQYFLPADGSLSTERAGGIWTDKSVFTDSTAFPGHGISVEPGNFLVALSAIASNMSVTGSSSVPTDTVFVLDVSGSMYNSGLGDDLAVAANASIVQLLKNPGNRVGVVLYSGSSRSNTNNNASVVLLPLGRYATDVDDQYITYDSGTISLDYNVVIEGTTRRPSSTGKDVTGATYIQKGLYTAMQQFTADSNVIDTAENRKPILVLMSDGAPTLASTNFKAPGQYRMGDGGDTSAGVGFVTQLTAAYAKQQVTQHYGTPAMFYTLGMGTSSDSVATSVLNPAASSTAITRLWTDYDALQVNDTLQVQSETYYQDARYVTKTDDALVKNYVSGYYTASDAQDMIDAFQAIVSEIELQAKYYPTLVSGDSDMSGYITFVDNIGKYMEVKSVEGILIGENTLFSGADLASNFVASGSGLGSVENPTALGDELVWAVMDRIGVSTADQARTLINLAYENGQLSYTSPTEFSNYIGWYANAAGEFLGFWHEGITTMPDPGDASLTDATRPAYIMRSYGYLGAVNEHTESDMMYAVVQVRESVTTGEQRVSFAIPAALIPTVTYQVTLGEGNTLTKLEPTGSKNPMRLLFQVGLDSEINEFNLLEKVDSDYIRNNNSGGYLNFYSNQFNPAVGYNQVNTYSYFRPSRENDRYYYQEDTDIYADQNGNLYHGGTPSGTLYHGYTVYEKSAGGQLTTREAYHTLTAEALASAEQVAGSDTWYIEKGTVRRDYNGYVLEKDDKTLTQTLDITHSPFTDIEGYTVDDLDHSFVFGITMGNNGRLRIIPSTGIRLTKAFEGTDTDGTAFPFTITGAQVSDGNYAAQKYLADGTVDASLTQVSFANHRAQVSLKAGESIAIVGLPAGIQLEITESLTEKYILAGTTGLTGNTVTTQNQTITPVVFTNAIRGTGSLTVAKEIEHPFGSDYQLPDPDRTFQITVALSLDGEPLAERSFHNGTVRTDENGKFTLPLKHNQSVTITGLPAGAEAVVTETLNPETDKGFTASYWDNGLLGDGQVTVEADKLSSVMVINSYQAHEIHPVNIRVAGTKTLTGDRSWEATDSFTFRLQRLDLANNQWITLAEKTVLGTDTEKVFSFSAEIHDEHYTTVGTYYYRIVEVEPDTPLPGVSYDKAVHGFAVKVVDKMTGQLEIESVTPTRDNTAVSGNVENGFDVAVSFQNVYSVAETTATIAMRKQVNNASLSPNALPSGFRFGVYTYHKDGDTVILDDQVGELSPLTTLSGTARISLSITQEGVYHYAVKEIDTGAAGWTYDDEIQLITVNATTETIENQDYLKAVVYAGEAETAPAEAANTLELSFTNTYTVANGKLPLDFISKRLDGRRMDAGEFGFDLYRYYPDKDSSTLIAQGTNAADGTVSFSDSSYVSNNNLIFTQVGTYFFYMQESTGDGKGIVSDKNTYRITVTVTDDGSGTLQVSKNVVNVEDSLIEFVNTYTAQPAAWTLQATKELRGRDLLNDEFTFLLTPAKNAQGDVEDGAVPYIAKNTTQTGEPNVTFPTLQFAAAGEYFFLVTEQDDSGNGLGITYDKSRYVVKVTVTDDGEGQLVASPSYTKLNGDDAGAKTAISFLNTYKAAQTHASIPGSKLLQGRALGDGEFTFQLFNSNAQWDELGFRADVTNGEDGLFAFSQIVFTDAGEYYFLIKEVQGDRGGVTYDNSVFRIQVTITDNLRGNLNAQVLVMDENGVPQENAQFVNIYEIKGNAQVTLSGKKTLENAKLTADAFNFQLFKTDSDFAVEEGQKPEKSGKNQENGQFAIDLTFTPEQVGQTLYYVLQEERAGKTVDGITYSNKAYQIAVEVLDDGNGSVATKVTVDGGAVKADALNFTNTYQAAPAVVNLDGEKVLKGRLLLPKEFTFQLFPADAEFKPLEDIEPLEAVNNGKGKFSFQNLELYQEGIYHLIIKEDTAAEHWRVTYDETVYYVSITVTDNGKGQLVAQAPVITKAGSEEEVEKIVFTNTFTPVPVGPPTGDPMALTLWIGAMTVSGLCLLVMVFAGKKKKNLG